MIVFPIRQSLLVESSVNELIDLLKSPMSEAELARMMPEENQQDPDVYTTILNNFTQRNTEALVKCGCYSSYQYCIVSTLVFYQYTNALFYFLFYCLRFPGTRLSLDSIKRRVQIKSGFSKTGDIVEDTKPPLFRANIVLAIPSIVMRPSLEDIQNGLNKSVQVILKMTEKIPQWQHLIQQQKQQQKVCVIFKKIIFHRIYHLL